MKGTGLVSDETSLRLTKACLKNKEGMQRFKKKRYVGAMGKGNTAGKTTEYQNRHGTCPLQLKTRLIEFIKCNRELPARGNKGRSIYKALTNRYGSWGHALAANGLPWFKRVGTTYRYAFSDGTVYKYNINQFYDREKLYNLIMEKCPVMHEDLVKNNTKE